MSIIFETVKKPTIESIPTPVKPVEFPSDLMTGFRGNDRYKTFAQSILGKKITGLTPSTISIEGGLKLTKSGDDEGNYPGVMCIGEDKTKQFKEIGLDQMALVKGNKGYVSQSIVGKKIANVIYMELYEDSGKGPVIILEDGQYIFVISDEEGNGMGCLMANKGNCWGFPQCY